MKSGQLFQISQVYASVESELTYQEIMEKDPSSHVVEDFPLSAGLEAIRYNIDKATTAWYNQQAPYPEAMEYLRKVAAICVRMGMKYHMPHREE